MCTSNNGLLSGVTNWANATNNQGVANLTQLGNYAGGALQVGSGILSAIGNYQSAKSYRQYVQAQAGAVVDNYRYQVRALNTQYGQQVTQANQQQEQVYLNNLKSQATAKASAAASGVEGKSIDELFNGYDRATALSDYITQRNLKNLGVQYSDNLDAARISALNSLNGIQQYNSNSIASTLLSNFGSVLTSRSNTSRLKSIIGT